MLEGSWTIEPCSRGDALALAAALGISETTASVLVRRGLSEPDEAARFLEGAPPGHDPFALGAMREACEAIRAAVADGRRICVHGDYDVDGICATALAVLVLRELGAEVEWHLPSRFEEGYGLRAETLARLADAGCGLVLTVDCGVTAVDEVAEARAAGLEVVVTDHHRGGDELPDCPVVGPYGDYPFDGLCGTGVVYKLAEALLGADSPVLSRHLDLVGLATIADVVPLVDENRALAIAGLRALATTQKPGLRALMRVAGVDPAAVDEGSVGFRLAPRINAAGRLCRPREALELLLTGDRDEAGRLAQRLEGLNRERQQVEDRILREAVAQVESWPEERRRRRGYVVAGADWHEGVIGIVASRLVERYGRPVVLIAGAEPLWKGSGRSIAAFDLHAALGKCAEHLERWGGHRAAAGLSIEPGEPPGVRRGGSRDAADAALADDDLRPVTRVDAIVPGEQLTLGLAAELARLAPFGLGNPGVTLAPPGVRARGARRRWGRASTCASASATSTAAATPAGDRLPPRPAARPLPARRPLRRRVPAAGEPLERHGLAAARRPPHLRRGRRLRAAPRLAEDAVEARRGGPDARRGRGVRGARARATAGGACSSRSASARCSPRRRSPAPPSVAS